MVGSYKKVLKLAQELEKQDKEYKQEKVSRRTKFLISIIVIIAILIYIIMIFMKSPDRPQFYQVEFDKSFEDDYVKLQISSINGINEIQIENIKLVISFVDNNSALHGREFILDEMISGSSYEGVSFFQHKNLSYLDIGEYFIINKNFYPPESILKIIDFENYLYLYDDKLY